MPTLKKLLAKFNRTERKILEVLIDKVTSLDWHELDIKKLKGYQDIFRLRKRKIRIIFTKERKHISIIAIERRSEKTYNF